jgi:hypothetical protein
MEFIEDDYRLKLEQDYEGIDIYLYEANDLNPLLFLNLKPLNQIDIELDDKTVIRDIPRDFFAEGDFFQGSVAKYNKSDKYKKISLLSIVHDILLENKDALHFIKNIFSTSLNNYKEEDFITVDAVQFWNKQLEKATTIPSSFYEDDQRYKLKIND